jgi:hypothetical protein
MPLVRNYKTNFNSGEISPKAYGRADIDSYVNGAERLRNFRQLVQGGITRRPGTNKLFTLVNGTNYQTERYIFDNNEQYILIFSDSEVIIWDSITETLATTLVGQDWTDAMIGDLYIASEGDVIVVMHGDLETVRITRTGIATFVSDIFPYETDSTTPNPVKYIPFEKHADESITIDPSGTSGSVTVIASAAYFTASHVGIRIRHKGKQMLITAYTSPTQVTASVIETLSDQQETEDWDEEAFSDIYGWPVSGIFHDQRFHFMGSKSLPRNTWSTNVAAFYKFDVGTGAPADSIQGIAAESNIGAIRAVASLRNLQVFADSGEIYIPATEARPLTPENLAYKLQSRYGTKLRQVAEFARSTLYVTPNNAIREFVFDELQSGFESFPLAYLGEHLLTDPIAIVSQLEGFGSQEQLAFILNSDGTLVVLMNETSEKITSFGLWETDGEYKNIMSIENKVYTIVDRVVDGTPVTWFEVFDLTKTLDGSTSDSDVTAKSVWTGLTDYANQEVSVISGNYYIGDYTIDGAGQLDISPVEVENITVGYNYTPTAIPLPPEIALNDGPTFGELRRVVKVVVLFEGTLSAKISNNRLIIRQTQEDLSEEPTPVSGRKEFFVRGWDRKGQIEIVQEAPLPITITSFNVELEF